MTDPLDGSWRRLHPASMLGSSLRALPGTVAGIIGSYTVLAREGSGGAVLAALAVLALVAGLTVLGWWRFRFRVGPREIAIEQGVLSRQRRVIPFDRVRDVAIERKLLARLIGTARVRIETGGGKAEEGELEMIALSEAERLREHIRRSNAGPVTASPFEDPVAADEPTIFAMNLRRVLTAGLFNFSLLFIVLLFGALQYLDDLRLIDVGDLIQDQRTRRLAGDVSFGQVAALAAALLLLGTVTGIGRTLAREYGFRLTVSPGGLRRRRGLFTLSEILIPARRTEAARVQRRWFSGLFGWRSLAFQTLGADPKEGGVQVAAPLARDGEVRAILGHADMPDAPVSLPLRPPPRALLRRCAPYFLLTLTFLALGLVRPALAALALLPALFALVKVLLWRGDRYLLGERALYMKRGLLTRTLWIVPFEKVQTLATTRGPLQRTFGLATVRVDTAGAPRFGAPRIADLPAAQAEALASALLAAFYERRSAARQSH